MIELYEIIGNSEDKIVTLKQWQSKAKTTFNTKLFNENLGAYVHYDLKNDSQIPFLTSSSFAAIYANIPSKERADQLVKTLMHKFGGDGRYLCASFDPDSERFNPKKYWRGPVWINLNWLLYNGLKNYGFTKEASRVKQDSIELIEKFGFYEYFDCRKNRDEFSGYGGNNFSWSAALIIDMLNR